MTFPDPTLAWRKSSFSGPTENCVEVSLGILTLVRDSKAPQGARLAISYLAWFSFLAALKYTPEVTRR